MKTPEEEQELADMAADFLWATYETETFLP
jgi:hypothetical protein